MQWSRLEVPQDRAGRAPGGNAVRGGLVRAARGRRRRVGSRQRSQLRRDLLDHVAHVLHQLGSLADQAVGAAAAAGARRAGHGEHLAALLQRPARRDQGAAALGGLHHHYAQGEAADEAVARREVVRQRARPQGMLRKHRAAALDAAAEIAMLRRIGNVRARAQHRHGPAASVQRGLVRVPVDAPGHAAHHHDAGRGQPPTQQPGHLAAVLARRARPHDAHRGVPGRLRRSPDVKHRGRIVYRTQPFRIGRVRVPHEPHPGIAHPPHLFRQAIPRGERQQPLHRRPAQPGNLPQPAPAVEERVRGVGEGFRDAPEPHAPKALNFAEREPGEVPPALIRRPPGGTRGPAH